MSVRNRFWLLGLILAAVGIVLARLVVKQIEQTTIKLGVYALGTLVAFAGLGFILHGIRRSHQ